MLLLLSLSAYWSSVLIVMVSGLSAARFFCGYSFFFGKIPLKSIWLQLAHMYTAQNPIVNFSHLAGTHLFPYSFTIRYNRSLLLLMLLLVLLLLLMLISRRRTRRFGHIHQW